MSNAYHNNTNTNTNTLDSINKNSTTQPGASLSLNGATSGDVGGMSSSSHLGSFYSTTNRSLQNPQNNLNTNNYQNQMNNYAALAAAAAAAVGSSTTTSNSNTNPQMRNQLGDSITPPTNNTGTTNSTATNNTINNSSNNNQSSNNLNSNNSPGVLPQNILNQLNAANLNNSAPSPNRQNPPILHPYFRSNSTMPTNNQQQQQQLSNLIQQQQQQLQQKKLVGSSNLLNFNNANPNMNSNLLNSTIARPNQLQPNSQTNPSDFPVLHRSSNSPFQQQHLQQLQQQLRANNSLNFNQSGPNSAPILNSSSIQNFMLQLASSASAQNSNLAPSPASQLMMNSLVNSQGNSNPLQYNLGLNSGSMSQQMSALGQGQKNVQTAGGNMWSNFGLGLKGQQSAADQQHQEFNIQQEDFPALPRPQSVHNKPSSDGTGQNLTSTNSSSSNDLSTLRMNEQSNNLQHSSSQNNVNSSSSNMLSTNSSGSSNSSSTQNNATSNKQPSITSQNQFPTSQSGSGNTQSGIATSQNQTNKNSVNTNLNNTNIQNNTSSTSSSSSAAKKGIIISPDGRISNVPPNMLLDQFGMVGLLAYLRAADREKDFFALALGTDLTALGLNLNSNENLYHSFLSPFSDVPCRLQDIDYPVPTEYIMNCQIKEKLAPIDVSRYSEDTLFYLFHMNGGDLMQLQAASVLYDRDWRYHTEKRFWLTKVPGLEPQQKTVTFEKGVYTVFDVTQWRRVQLEMTIEYNKLAEKPQLPTNMLQNSSSSSSSNNNLPSVLNLQQQLQHQQQLQQTFTSGIGSVANSGVPLTTNPTSASSF